MYFHKLRNVFFIFRAPGRRLIDYQSRPRPRIYVDVPSRAPTNRRQRRRRPHNAPVHEPAQVAPPRQDRLAQQAGRDQPGVQAALVCGQRARRDARVLEDEQADASRKKGQIALGGAVVKRGYEAPGRLTIAVAGQARVYVLEAASDEEAEVWVQAMCAMGATHDGPMDPAQKPTSLVKKMSSGCQPPPRRRASSTAG